MGLIKCIKLFDSIIIDDVEITFSKAPGTVNITLYIQAPINKKVVHVKCVDPAKLEERREVVRGKHYGR